MKKAMLIENGFAYLFNGSEIVTTHLHVNRYVRIDDGRQYPQLCNGGRRRGGTLIYMTDEGLARDCRATLYKTREEYEAAKQAIVAEIEEEERQRDEEDRRLFGQFI
jgi:hypothetical protein